MGKTVDEWLWHSLDHRLESCDRYLNKSQSMSQYKFAILYLILTLHHAIKWNLSALHGKFKYYTDDKVVSDVGLISNCTKIKDLHLRLQTLRFLKWEWRYQRQFLFRKQLCFCKKYIISCRQCAWIHTFWAYVEEEKVGQVHFLGRIAPTISENLCRLTHLSGTWHGTFTLKLWATTLQSMTHVKKWVSKAFGHFMTTGLLR